MARRLIESERWNDRWFMALSPDSKNILSFMEAMCDVGGVWEPNFEDAEFRIGFTARSQQIDWNQVYEDLNRIPESKFLFPDVNAEAAKKDKVPHVVVLKNGKWWLPRFIKFQYGKKGEEFRLFNIPLHIPIFKSLKDNGCWDKFLHYYPNVVPDDLAKAPPTDMKKVTKAPTLEEVLEWDEGKGLPEEHLKLFHVTYRANGWKVNGQRVEDFHALLYKWRLRYERDKGDQAWKSETPTQLKLRVEAIDTRIAELGSQTHKPAGKTHEEIKPEAMEEIRRLRAVKANYEEAIREKGGTNDKHVSGSKSGTAPAKTG